MSAQSLQVLALLLDRAKEARDQALRQLQDALQVSEAARLQHGQLTQYRSDYQLRWTQSFSQSTTVDILGCYQSFGGRLNLAVDQQDLLATHAQGRLNGARQLLVEREQRVAAIQKLIERREAELTRLQHRREQSATDEQAARTALANPHPLSRLGA